MNKKIIFGIFILILINISCSNVLAECLKVEASDITIDGPINTQYLAEGSFDEFRYGYTDDLSFQEGFQAGYDHYDHCLSGNYLAEYYCDSGDGYFDTIFCESECITENYGNAPFGKCVGEAEPEDEESETYDVGTISVIETSCNDGIDNDNDEDIDLGGCDINNNGVLTDNQDYPIARTSFEEGESLLASVLDEQWVKDYCTQNNGDWINADEVCETAFQDADAIWTSASNWPWDYEATACANGVDDDSDGKIDYNNGNLGWCDVDTNGRVGESNVYSEIADESVDETQVTKQECLTDYGNQDAPIARKGFFRNLLGFATLNLNKITGSAVRSGLVQREPSEPSRVNQPAVWYNWDSDCINAEDDSEASAQAQQPVPKKSFFQRLFK